MKLQVSLLALVFSGSRSAWTPSVHRSVTPMVSSTRPLLLGPLHMSPSNSTGNKEDPSATTSSSTPIKDVNAEAFMAGMDRELEALKKQNNSTMDAYNRALQDLQGSATTTSSTSKSETTSTSTSTSTSGKGFGKPSPNEAKKKAFMEKNRRPVKEDDEEAEDIIADQIVNQLESTPPPVQEEKSPRDLIKEAKKAKEEKKTYFPPKVEPVAAQRKTYFPPEPTRKAVVPPPPPKPQATKDEPKTYFPPTPMAQKPPLVVQTEKEQTPKETTPIASSKTTDPVVDNTKPLVEPAKETVPITAATTTDPVVEKSKPLVEPAEETTPITAAKTPNPVVGKSNPLVEPVQAEKEEIPVKPKKEQLFKRTPKIESSSKEEVMTPTPSKTEAPISVPIAKIASQVPIDTGIAASKVVDKVKVDAPPAKAKKFELPKIELPKVQLPKVTLPKVDFDPIAMAKKMDSFKLNIPKDTVEQAKDFAKNAGGTILDAAKVVAKDGKDWAIHVRSSLNTTRVDDLDITYEEALSKVAQGGRGFLKICSLLGNVVKDTTMIFANEIQKKNPTTTTASHAPQRIVPAKAVVAQASSVVNESKPAPTLGKVAAAVKETKKEAEKVVVVKSSRINLRDIVLPEPELDGIVREFEDDEEVEPTMEFKAPDELNEIASKASSIFGNFLSSASSLVESVKSKAKEEGMKLQVSVEELKETGKKNAPMMSKTKPVGGAKKRGLFFLDAEDE